MNLLAGIKTIVLYTVYADDVHLLFSSTPNILVQLKLHAPTSLKRMTDWYSENGLKMNLNKTQLMHYFCKKKLNLQSQGASQ